MTALALADDTAQTIRLVTDATNTDATARSYRTALAEFFAWHDGRPITRASVMEYRKALLATRAPATVNARLAAVRALVREGAAAGYIPASVAQSIESIRGVPTRGVRSGVWLSDATARVLLASPDTSTLAGLRDRALLAILVGTGLRRNECASVSVSQLRQVDGRWAFVDVNGKGGRVRTVPVPPWAYMCVRSWLDAAEITDGRVLRPVNRGGRLAGSSMTASAIWRRVRLHAARAGLSVSPHDLRRTFARLAMEGGADIAQLSLTLGHASVRTTERYVNARQNFHDAPCDHLRPLA